jgi:hypothetical protein
LNGCPGHGQGRARAPGKPASRGVFVRGIPAAEMFTAVVGLSVAAIPEGLPTILTVTLAIGVQRMAARRAIVRQLPAVEALGAVSIICTDKTGTVTRNEMTVRTVRTAAGAFEVTGVGYDPHGTFRRGDRDVVAAEDPVLAELARAALLCNDAALRRVTDDGVGAHATPRFDQDRFVPIARPHPGRQSVDTGEEDAFVREKELSLVLTARHRRRRLGCQPRRWRVEPAALRRAGGKENPRASVSTTARMCIAL